MCFAYFDMDGFLRNLANDRPVFHSECDFKHALAFAIHAQHPEWHVRLEWPVDIQHAGRNRIYHDIWVENNNEFMVIELKYRTARDSIHYNNEWFHLQNQGAQNDGSYYFIRDIERLETTIGRYRNERRYAVGYAVMITNDHRYPAHARSNAQYAAFSLEPRENIHGLLAWNHAEREDRGPINLIGYYSLNWQPYSILPDNYRQFQYLSVRVDGNQIDT